MDTHKTKVIFRKFKEGDIIALFPELSYRHRYITECYQHIGQHGESDYQSAVSMKSSQNLKSIKTLKKSLKA